LFRPRHYFSFFALPTRARSERSPPGCTLRHAPPEPVHPPSLPRPGPVGQACPRRRAGLSRHRAVRV
jgi:hypothetical protein